MPDVMISVPTYLIPLILWITFSVGYLLCAAVKEQARVFFISSHIIIGLLMATAAALLLTNLLS